jgi:hypothetical protein
MTALYMLSKLCPPCTPSCTPVRSVRPMRTRVFPCGTVNASDLDPPIRIKSPQLYRLSYRPKLSEQCRYSRLGPSLLVRRVPAMCPALITGGPYHGVNGQEKGPGVATSRGFRFIGETVVSVDLLGAP